MPALVPPVDDAIDRDLLADALLQMQGGSRVPREAHSHVQSPVRGLTGALLVPAKHHGRL